MSDQQQAAPTEADYAMASLAEDLAAAARLKSTYYGKAVAAERTNQLLVQENQDLRAKLAEAEQQLRERSADTKSAPEPEVPAAAKSKAKGTVKAD